MNMIAKHSLITTFQHTGCVYNRPHVWCQIVLTGGGLHSAEEALIRLMSSAACKLFELRFKC
jgi:hypothetical protein